MTADPRPSFAEQWRERGVRDRDGWTTVLTWDPWAGCDKNVEPGYAANNWFFPGLELLWGGEDAMARAFFSRALEVCERAEKEKSWPASGDSRLLLDRELLRRVRGHCLGFLGGPSSVEAIQADFRAASVGYETWCAEFSASEWQPLGPPHYLSAVQLALLANDGDRARTLLKSKRSFRYHVEQRALLVALATGRSDAGFRAQYASFFDGIRGAYFQPTVIMELHYVRLELALLYQALCSDGGPLDWWSAARTISA